MRGRTMRNQEPNERHTKSGTVVASTCMIPWASASGLDGWELGTLKNTGVAPPIGGAGLMCSRPLCCVTVGQLNSESPGRRHAQHNVVRETQQQSLPRSPLC